MNNHTLLGPWVRRFLLEHLVTERNLSHNTQCSYCDTLILLIPFTANRLHQSIDRLSVLDLSADLVRLFLTDLEQSRRCTIATRNQRRFAPTLAHHYRNQRSTSPEYAASPQFMHLLALSQSTVRSISHGVVRFVLSHSRRRAKR
jgi:integrase/recombinase XerD